MVEGDTNSKLEFRGCEMGSSKEEIIRKEGSSPTQTNSNGSITTLKYPDELRGENVQIIYKLVNDKLAAGVYTSENIIEAERADQIYQKWKKLLQEKYGNPDEEHQTKNPNVVAESGGFRAVSAWADQGVSIRNARRMGQGVYCVQIQYEEDKLLEELNEANKQNDLDKL